MSKAPRGLVIAVLLPDPALGLARLALGTKITRIFAKSLIDRRLSRADLREVQRATLGAGRIDLRDRAPETVFLDRK